MKKVKSNYTLNNDEANLLLDLPVKEVKSTGVTHDFELSKDSRLLTARQILNHYSIVEKDNSHKDD